MIARASALLLLLAFWLSAAPAEAAVDDAAGLWALTAEGRTLSLLELRRDARAPGGWTGTWTRPEHMVVSDIGTVSGVSGPTVARRIRSAAVQGDALALTIDAASTDGPADIFTFHPLGRDHADFSRPGIPVPPLAFARAAAAATIAGGWDPERSYSLDSPRPSNPEMTAIFTADQDARKEGADIDWSKVGPEDDKRRARTRVLLESGALRSGDDFYHAAFIFQHGGTPADYLLAHTLAIAAVARGRRDATWIAWATLDRYLQRIGQKQIYGTQYNAVPGAPVTQEPYDRSVIPEGIRETLGAPTRERQEAQLKMFEDMYREKPQPKTQ